LLYFHRLYWDGVVLQTEVIVLELYRKLPEFFFLLAFYIAFWLIGNDFVDVLIYLVASLAREERTNFLWIDAVRVRVHKDDGFIRSD